MALDITKVANPVFQLLRVPTYDDIPRLLDDYLSRFIDEHMALWNRLEGKRTMAVMLRLSLMALIGTHETNLIQCQHYAVAELPGVRGRNERLLQVLIRALRDGLQA